MAAYLEVWTPAGPELVALAGERVTLGRGPGNDLALPTDRRPRLPMSPWGRGRKPWRPWGWGAEGLPCVHRRNRVLSHVRGLGAGWAPD